MSYYGWTACNSARHVANAPQYGLDFIILFLIPKVSKLRLTECKSLAKRQRSQATELGREWAGKIPECKPFTSTLFCLWLLHAAHGPDQSNVNKGLHSLYAQEFKFWAVLASESKLLTLRERK